MLENLDRAALLREYDLARDRAGYHAQLAEQERRVAQGIRQAFEDKFPGQNIDTVERTADGLSSRKLEWE